MDTIILYLLIFIIEAFIFYWYCSQRFVTIHSKKYIFSVFLISYGILFILSGIKSIEINTLMFTFANIFIIKLIYHTKWETSIFHSLITTCINTLSEITIMGLSSQFTGTILFTLSDITYLSLLTITSKSLYFFGLNTIAKLLPLSSEEIKTSDKKQINTNKITALLNLIPLMSIFIIITLFSVLLSNNIDNRFRYMLSSCAVLLILINILIFYIYHYTLRKNSELTELQVQYQKEYDMAEYYKKLFTQNENQQILIHDIRKHLTSIYSLNEQNDQIKIRHYLNTLLDSSELQNTIHISDNEMLNSIMCHYMQICMDKHIEFKTDIRKHSLTYMDYSDLTTLFCNLLENSIEASSGVPDSYIELNISDKENTSMSIINVINTCRFCPTFDKSGRPATSKKNKSRHGLGIKSIERVVDKYGGSIKMYFDEEKMAFHTIILLKNV